MTAATAADHRLARWIAAQLIALLLVIAPRPAAADSPRPSTQRLVLTGGLMAVPVYVLGVFWHEGAHAAAGVAFGAEVVAFKLYPHRDPASGAFFFGRTVLRGELSADQLAIFYLAPRFVDLALLSGYAGLLATDSLPSNHYGQLALAVLATGAWIDFSKDVYRWQPANDLNRFHSVQGRKSEWQRLPWRLLHAGLIAATGYALYRGYDQLFATDEPAMILPLASGAF